jgi:hypothetical protein
MFLKAVSMVKRVPDQFKRILQCQERHWQLKDPLPGVEMFNDFPAAKPIKGSSELPIVCRITYGRTGYTVRDFGEWMKLCFAWMILCCWRRMAREQDLPARQTGRHPSHFQMTAMAFRGKPPLLRPIEVGAP